MKRFKNRQNGEHDEQCALFQWIRLKANQDERYNMIYAIPNGGSRHPAEAARLKAAGVKAGVADIAVDVPIGGYHGLKIEMKVAGNNVTPLQADYLRRAEEYGYKTAVCYGAQAAIDVIGEYMS